MVQITRSETFDTKYNLLGSSSRAWFDIRFNYVWRELLDIDATGEQHAILVEESILGSNKYFKAVYSREDDKIYLDIIDAPDQ